MYTFHSFYKYYNFIDRVTIFRLAPHYRLCSCIRLCISLHQDVFASKKFCKHGGETGMGVVMADSSQWYLPGLRLIMIGIVIDCNRLHISV